MPTEQNDTTSVMMYGSQNKSSYYNPPHEQFHHPHHHHLQTGNFQPGYERQPYISELAMISDMTSVAASVASCGGLEGRNGGNRLSCSSASSDCSTSSGNSHNTSFEEIGQNAAPRKHQQYRAKYKTEICKDWELNRQCPKGEKCSFAHGLHELRKKVHVSQKYKTTKCRSFHEKGYCIYGPRCQFLHDVRLEGCNINILSRHRVSYKQMLNENLTQLNDTYARTGCDLMTFLQSNIYYNSESTRGRLTVFQTFSKGK